MSDAAVIVGSCATPLWGLTSAQRITRIFEKNGVAIARPDALPDTGRVFLADARFAFDPAWVVAMKEQPSVLTLGGRVVLANLSAEHAPAALAAMTAGTPWRATHGITEFAADRGAEIYNHELRKRETPFVRPLTPETVPGIERDSYYGAYKGVTDLLTKYAWPVLAFHLTRLAARLRLTPNMVTAIGLVLCIAATFAFAEGWYWSGLAMGWTMMVLDTVDGKLARVTITSSKFGNLFDHGIDLIHPPFWYWAWAWGLAAYGTPLAPPLFEQMMWAILVTYVAGRLVEGAFQRLFGMHIHVWERIDSQFRLITARRNPNVLLMTGSLLFGRPDIGLLLVVGWSALSFVFHLVRLFQALLARMSGKPIVSWLRAA